MDCGDAIHTYLDGFISGIAPNDGGFKVTCVPNHVSIRDVYPYLQNHHITLFYYS